MRKSNWIILALLVVASAFFLWLWYYMNFNLVDNPLDMVLSVVWWAVVIVAILAIRSVEKKRRERVRTSYIAPGSIYNSEAGLQSLPAGASPVAALQGILQNLKYNFNMEEFPEKSEVRFVYVVRTKKFADDGETWEGEVSVVARPDDEPQPFQNKAELLNIVEGVPLPTTASGMPTASQQTAPLGA